jgi:hypothetical protein
VSRPCQIARCERVDAELLSACGIYYVCPACRGLVACLTAMYQEDDAVEVKAS